MSQQRAWHQFSSREGADPAAAPGGIAGRGPYAGHEAPLEAAPHDVGHHAQIGLPRALGIPPAGSAYRRSKAPSPFDLRALPSIERRSVEVFDLVCQHFPTYLRSPALSDAVGSFLTRLLAPTTGEKRGVAIEVKPASGGSPLSSMHATDEITIGTHATNQVRLSSPQVSRRHARIVREGGGYQLVDQGSSNGTFLRGERIQPGYAYPLQNGETFSCPGFEITLRWAEEAPAPIFESLRVSSLRLEDGAGALAQAPRQGLLAAIRIEPGGARLLAEIGLPLGQLLVRRVLGGNQPLAGAAAVSVQPLTSADKGVLELVVVKLLDDMQRAWGGQAEATLHLERVYDGGETAAAAVLGNGPVLVVSAGLTFDNRRDAVRLLVPRDDIPKLSEQLERTIDPAGSTIEELYHRYADVVGVTRIELACEVGAMKIARRELRELEPGSICFPEQLSLRIENDAVVGEVTLTPGLGTGRAKIHARLTQYATPARMELIDFELGASGRPEEHAMTDPTQGHEELGDGVAMLDDVPMPMVIELGRLSLTVRDLAKLRRGQVLELARGAEDPVNLVVDGHLVGTGKLVNVEGEIGVQILELLR